MLKDFRMIVKDCYKIVDRVIIDCLTILIDFCTIVEDCYTIVKRLLNDC